MPSLERTEVESFNNDAEENGKEEEEEDKLCVLCESDHEVLSICPSCILCRMCALDKSFEEVVSHHEGLSCYICEDEFLNDGLSSVVELQEAYKKLFDKKIEVKPPESIASDNPSEEEEESVDADDSSITRTNTKESSGGINKLKKAVTDLKENEKSKEHENQKLFNNIDIETVDLQEYFSNKPFRKERGNEAWRSKVKNKLHKYLGDIPKERTKRNMSVNNLSFEICGAFLSWFGIALADMNKNKPKPIKTKSKKEKKGKKEQTENTCNAYLASTPSLIPFPSHFYTLVTKQHGLRALSEDHLYSFCQAAVEYQNNSFRIGTFGFLSGLIDPDAYCAEASSVFFEILQLLFANLRDCQEVLECGEDSGWIRSDQASEVIQILFRKSSVWNLSFLDAACKSKKISLPWDQEERQMFMKTIEALSESSAGKGFLSSSLRGAEFLVNLDKFLFSCISGWIKEKSRTVDKLHEVEENEKLMEDKEEERRNHMISVAQARPFLPAENEILKSLIEKYLADNDLEAMPKTFDQMKTNVTSEECAKEIDHADTLVCEPNEWIKFHEINRARIINRSPEILCRHWCTYEKERKRKERIEWNFKNWEWDEDWEWGGLTIEHDPFDTGTIEEKYDRWLENKKEAQAELMRKSTRVFDWDAGSFKKPEYFKSNNSITEYFKSNNSTDTSLKTSSSTSIIPDLQHAWLSQRRIGTSKSSADLRRPSSAVLRSDSAVIDFRHYCANAKAAEALGKKLRDHEGQVSVLALEGNVMRDQACAAVISSVRKHHMLSTLDISRNRASFKSVQAFNQNVLSFTFLNCLNLKGNRLGNKNAIIFLNSIGSLRKLETLNLSDNQIGGNSSIAKALSKIVETSSALRELYLAWNLLETSDIMNVLEFLSTHSTKHNSSLTVLDLHFNKIEDDVNKSVGEVFKYNSVLQTFKIGYNKLTDKSIETFLNALEQNDTLQVLSVKGNEFSKNAVLQLKSFQDKQGAKIEVNVEYNDFER